MQAYLPTGQNPNLLQPLPLHEAETDSDDGSSVATPMTVDAPGAVWAPLPVLANMQPELGNMALTMP